MPTDELILDAENHSTNSVNIGVVLVTEDDDRITYPPCAVPPGEAPLAQYLTCSMPIRASSRITKRVSVVLRSSFGVFARVYLTVYLLAR